MEIVHWLLVIVIASVQATDGCNVVMQGLGTVNPMGDVEEEVGSTLRLQCTLNRPTNTSITSISSKMIFWKKDRKPISSDSIQVLDDYTAELTIHNTTVNDSGVYLCLRKAENSTLDKGKYVCHNNVAIGSAPLNVTDFSCVSPNWEFMRCTFVKPFNPVNTTYRMTVASARARMKSMPCNLTHDKDEVTWVSNSTFVFTQPDNTFHFTLFASNKYGEKSWRFSAHLYERIKPNPPKEIETEDIWNSTSLQVVLTPPEGMALFPGGLVYRVFYRSQWDLPDTWTILQAQKSVTTLVDLQPHTDYWIKAQVRPTTVTDELLWSGNTTTKAVTMMDVPDMPPKVAEGSFQERHYLDNRTIFVFWQMIPKYKENGLHFMYNVTATSPNDSDLIIFPANVTANYAQFLNLSLETEYIIGVQSVNSKGGSGEISRVRVAKRSLMPNQVESFTVIYFNNGIYELSWKPSSDPLDKLASYTLFWCAAIKPHPFMCNGNLSWLDVEPRTTAHNITLKDDVNYHFAVAANTPEVSSGMVWATCIVPYNGTLNKMKKVSVTAIGSTRLKVMWKLDCSERIGIVIGFRIYYCKVESADAFAPCIGERRDVFQPGSMIESAVLNSLNPYTSYKVTVAVISRAGDGEQSVARVERTYEAGPSSAFNTFFISNTTNTSVTLNWTEPKEPNGILRRYKIYYNGHRMVRNATGHDESVTLTNLASYTNYSIKMAACTNTDCSDERHAKDFQTLVGVPGQMQRPSITVYNQSYVLASFEDPVEPNGPIDSYNLFMVMTPKDGDNQTQWYYNVSKEFVVETQCSDPQFHTATYDFAVQAINLVSDEPLVGELSDFVSYNCLPMTTALSTTIIVVVATTVGIIAFVLAFGYGYVLFKRKFREMQNIKIYLPKGLETDSLKSGCDFSSIQPYPPFKRNGEQRMNGNGTTNPRLRNTSGDTRVSVSSMDELLHNHSDCKVDVSGDSSSGLSSVSSAHTTRSNLSSESGHDLDSIPPTTPDTVFTDNPVSSLKILPPGTTLEVLPEASPPPNYSQFAQHLNDGYLPTVASVSRLADDGGYVLPSVPPVSYSQFGTAQNPGYMNLAQEPNALRPADSYSQLGIVAEPVAQSSGTVYSTLAMANEPMTSERNPPTWNPAVSNGYVAPSLAESPFSAMPLIPDTSPKPGISTSNPETDRPLGKMEESDTSASLPMAYSRLSFHDPNARPSKGYVALPDFNTLASRQEPQPEHPTDADVPSTSKGKTCDYVALDTVEEMDNVNDAMRSSVTSNDEMKSSLTSTDPMKSSVTSNDEAMKSSLTSEEAMKMSLASDDAMKSSLTSDGYDSPGPYSRVASMTFDESDACKES